ncbi:hemin ABC transporter substrate-binding protein [Marivivens niveibacter]|uniref:Hemin ABC transporter substrate-binding protein n=1 Tax=Marivivens niveibacter TaxID=1930667 RepID=A0A251WVH1_9RHOB|nr:ABC transporter substrate-binding protein [Marivivens niveibacter]OUD08118.1 hemin ABC transporter substrate-binding protein [Marivivens niveibacter]
MFTRIFSIVAAAAIGSTAIAQEAEQRIVSIGGTVTEIIYALGKSDLIVARDTTSTYPAEASQLPDVGYMRALSPEGVLSVDPTLIIAEEGSGPIETIDVLKEASIEYVTVPTGYTADAVAEKIMIIGEALDESEAAATLAAQVTDDMQAAAQTAAHADPKSVLFVLSVQGDRVMAAGQQTSADAIISLAGGQNAMGAFYGYKPVSNEAIIEAAPDLILMMQSGGGHPITDEQIIAHPGLGTTPAARDGNIARIDGLLLLGFGPRTGDAIQSVNTALYAE